MTTRSIFIVLMFAVCCVSCHNPTATGKQQCAIGAERIDEFRQYVIDRQHFDTIVNGVDTDYCPVLDLGYIEYPVACADSAVLLAIQKTLDSIVFGDMYTGGMWKAKDAISVWESPSRPLLYWNFEELWNLQKMYRQSYVVTVYDQDSIYTARYRCSAFTGPYTDSYLNFDLQTGRLLDFEDFYTPSEQDSILTMLERMGIGLPRMMSCGLTEFGRVLHYGYRPAWTRMNDSIPEEPFEVWLDSDAPYVLSDMMTVIAKQNKNKVAQYISYPFYRPYPIRHIRNRQEFVRQYDYIIGEDCRTRMAHAIPEEWTQVGWRGYMIDNGLAWGDGDGAGIWRITSIAYPNPREDALWERLAKEERQILGTTSSFIPILCYFAPDLSFLVHIGRDTLIDPTSYLDKGYIIRCIPRGHSLSDTTATVCGIRTIEGSCGNELYTARIDDTTFIEVWNADCGFRERTSGAYGCRFVSIDTTLYRPASQDIVPLYEIPDSAIIANTTYLMQPIYLRDIVSWWGR